MMTIIPQKPISSVLDDITLAPCFYVIRCALTAAFFHKFPVDCTRGGRSAKLWPRISFASPFKDLTTIQKQAVSQPCCADYCALVPSVPKACMAVKIIVVFSYGEDEEEIR